MLRSSTWNPKKIFFFAIDFWQNISSGHCFHKHDIWEFSSRAGINWYWIRLFCCFAVKPIHLWIYFQNFCNFVCMLMNAKERSLNFLFPSFTSLTSLVKKNCRQILFETSKTDDQKKDKDHSLAVINVHANLQKFWKYSTNLKGTGQNKKTLIH